MTEDTESKKVNIFLRIPDITFVHTLYFPSRLQYGICSFSVLQAMKSWEGETGNAAAFIQLHKFLSLDLPFCGAKMAAKAIKMAR